MALMTSYLLKTSNLSEFFSAIQSAKAPERFTHKFLKDLEFTSSNDRLLLAILKGLRFIDENGVPQQRYFNFLDQSVSGRVLAEAIEEAYSDLFDLRKDAQNMDLKDVKGKFRSLTQGQKSDNVIHNMAVTFKALCEQADWEKPERAPAKKKKATNKGPNLEEANDLDESTDHPTRQASHLSSDKLQLHYNIQLILPNSRDPAVFDALFTSLTKHLL